MKYVKFEKRIISWVSLIFTIIMVIVIAIALFRVSNNLLNVADHNDIQNANPQTTATGPVTQDFTTHPVDEQYLEQLAVQFNNQNTGSSYTAIVPQSSTNQDVVLLGLNGELANPPTAQTPTNNVTAPGESASDATSNSDGGNSNSSNKNPITEIINDIFHQGNNSTNNSNSNNSNSNGNSNTTSNSANTPAENNNSNNSNGTNSSDVNNANSNNSNNSGNNNSNNANTNANSGNSNTNSTGTAPAGNSQNGNSSTGGNTSTGATGAATNNNSIANKINQMENTLNNNTTKPTGN